ncbi:hypothetical protein BC1002_6513 [Paraburkholderia atlantica]|uniref:Uncharacterized protein n=1 Tax=Paraburkholderia atlantica TaxID=2654982 RepID=D5WMA9_PARAM|nr:hypothetical protein BC1002_6513 [Paraburkholderia atlantica]
MSEIRKTIIDRRASAHFSVPQRILKLVEPRADFELVLEKIPVHRLAVQPRNYGSGRKAAIRIRSARKILPVSVDNDVIRIGFNFAMSVGHIQLQYLASGILA